MACNSWNSHRYRRRRRCIQSLFCFSVIHSLFYSATTLSINKPSRVTPYSIYSTFSNLIRTNFCRFLKRKKKLVRGSNPHLSFNRPLHAAPSEVARWVSAAWKTIPESIIVRSFKKCCISNALDGSEMTFCGRTMVKIKMIVTGCRIKIQLWVMTESLMNNKL